MMDFLLRLISCVEPVQLRHEVLAVSRTLLLLCTEDKTFIHTDMRLQVTHEAN